MKNPKLRILNYVIPLITLLISIVCYFRLPDQIALSWDLNGAASSYEAKWHLFLMSGLGLVIAVDPTQADAAIAAIEAAGEKAYRVGSIEAGEKGVILK